MLGTGQDQRCCTIEHLGTFCAGITKVYSGYAVVQRCPWMAQIAVCSRNLFLIFCATRYKSPKNDNLRHAEEMEISRLPHACPTKTVLSRFFFIPDLPIPAVPHTVQFDLPCRGFRLLHISLRMAETWASNVMCSSTKPPYDQETK